MDGWMDGQIDRQIDRQIERQIGRQNSNTEFEQKGQIKPKAMPQNCSSRMCSLCLAEKVVIAQFEGTELSSNCRRKNNFFIANITYYTINIKRLL